MFIDTIEKILDPFMIQDWINTVITVISLIPAPMGILITLSVIIAVIRAVL